MLSCCPFSLVSLLLIIDVVVVGFVAVVYDANVVVSQINLDFFISRPLSLIFSMTTQIASVTKLSLLSFFFLAIDMLWLFFRCCVYFCHSFLF
jgi:hypothetical protein